MEATKETSKDRADFNTEYLRHHQECVEKNGVPECQIHIVGFEHTTLFSVNGSNKEIIMRLLSAMEHDDNFSRIVLAAAEIFKQNNN